MKTYEVRVKGITPLLHHRMTEESLMGLLAPKSKKKKIAEERTPRDIAESHAYRMDDGQCYIPSGYVSGAFAYAASEYKQTNSKKSYKAIAQGIFRPLQEHIKLIDENDTPIDNFEVDIRKATNHLAGAVAVCRPRFDRWEASFQVSVNTDLISENMALQILTDAGVRAGLGSFRVQKGGWFGQFNVVHFREKACT